MYRFVRNYRDDPILRRGFNTLAAETFGLDFEMWYQNGFWGDDYEPCSMVLGERVVANVSLNRTDLIIGGQRHRVYQLGTVMTAPEHRDKGLIRAIMEQIEPTIADAEGVYLFANDSVLNFYPRFGFTQGQEYFYTKAVVQTGNCMLEQVPMDGPSAWSRLRCAMASDNFTAGCRMSGNPGLIFFYVAQFMQDCVWHHSPTDTWIIAEQDGHDLMIHNVFTASDISLDEISHLFGSDIRQVTLGFAPADPSGWDIRELKEEDSTFFVKGNLFEQFSQRQLRIPSLSHA
ncbi:MAG: GNAT family N-acetyltransferase [Oscillospiraceae bacterium]|nr:GNAT family N-acetyltransferase [Oscillospiraceae bacterium]